MFSCFARWHSFCVPRVLHDYCVSQDHFGRAPLHWACQHCDVGLVTALLSHASCDVNTRTGGGDTPLHWACKELGRGADVIPVVETLLAAGAAALLFCRGFYACSTAPCPVGAASVR